MGSVLTGERRAGDSREVPAPQPRQPGRAAPPAGQPRHCPARAPRQPSLRSRKASGMQEAYQCQPAGVFLM